MPHYLRFVRALALGSALAAGATACDDDDDDDTDDDQADLGDPGEIADAGTDGPPVSVDGPLPPPELPV